MRWARGSPSEVCIQVSDKAPRIQLSERAEAIAVRTNVLNGTARIEWAPHTEGYVD